MDLKDKIANLITEAVFWQGKYKNLDKLMWHMYDQGILTATEKKEKDVRFRRYYRYFNDGDFPRGLKTANGNPVYDGTPKKQVEQALDDDLRRFIKRILTKKQGKYNRAELMQQANKILSPAQ